MAAYYDEETGHQMTYHEVNEALLRMQREREGKTLIGTCRNCESFERYSCGKHGEVFTGFCRNDEVFITNLVKPDFGCIHWKEKTQ
jgi:hypothetical protein